MTQIRRFGLTVLILALSVSAATADELSELKQTFVSGTDAKDRLAAGMDLALKNPDAFAKAVDEVLKAKLPADAELFARIAVKLKVRHLRLLLVWAASQYGPEASLAAFLDRIDNDYPMESVRAIEGLGFLRNHGALSRLMDLLRSPNELIAVQAARAIGRVGSKGDAGLVLDAAIAVDNGHARVHLVWALQDLTGGKGTAQKMLAKYMGKQGTQGFRAKEAMAILEDGIAPPEDYKVKLETIRTFFGKKDSPKLPPIDGPKDETEKVKKALAELAKKSPAWYHLVCATLSQIKVSGAPDILDHKAGILHLRFLDVSKWDRSELFEYYIVRYATILFLGKMGDPLDKHRGWEEGMMEGWWYAMDHTQIALDEDLLKFIQEALKNAPW
ncbi:MAG: HEAT repeat domain-containing protein [Planctomycetes bacterium]|nr:HEAT repeat domain-containing protein [Planctomycetota bacterium]